ncbi:hypothetical protein KGD83_06000 [Nocardiopsis akebiae]|uniref:Uncharacterized protein n=1 Tax=Nocardiopsis akebiae TaxID=2831968 RepID=A0ABX8C9F6_9ACTN|nr:hypothetical protein [Nocardiopsis akebiae]QUX30097.1 hypothetical protein KGD83_06000 [Nocardiopsis akebiae]
MELTLSGGYNVILTPDMRRSIRLAAPLGGRLDVWCPDVRKPGESAPLIAQGLAERDAQGVLVLTEHGIQARSLLVQLAGLVGELGHEGRPTLDPSLPQERARRLNLALEAVRGGRPRRGAGADGRDKAFARVVYALLWALVTCWMVLDLPLGAELALVTASSLAVAGAVVARARHQRADGKRDPVRIVTASEGEFVSPGALDGESRALLERAQRAVDAVLGSPLHERGLLLDTVRNRVVLADVEWSLARSLLHQTRVRERIARTPTPGERSREAAARAGAVLAAETAGVTARIAVLEDYADRVRAAELDDQDRRSARELDAIAAEAAEAGAVHEQSAETLDSLVRAQELALRVAALADDQD